MKELGELMHQPVDKDIVIHFINLVLVQEQIVQTLELFGELVRDGRFLHIQGIGIRMRSGDHDREDHEADLQHPALRAAVMGLRKDRRQELAKRFA